jgi:hypothetical protein
MGAENLAQQEFDFLALHPATCCHTDGAHRPTNFLLFPLTEAALRLFQLKAVACRNDSIGFVLDSYSTLPRLGKANYINIAACFMYN